MGRGRPRASARVRTGASATARARSSVSGHLFFDANVGFGNQIPCGRIVTKVSAPVTNSARVLRGNGRSTRLISRSMHICEGATTMFGGAGVTSGEFRDIYRFPDAPLEATPRIVI